MKKSFSLVVPIFEEADAVAFASFYYKKVGLRPIYALDSKRIHRRAEVEKIVGQEVAIYQNPGNCIEANYANLAALSPTDWILRVDCDEVPNAALLEFCQKFIEHPTDDYCGFDRDDLRRVGGQFERVKYSRIFIDNQFRLFNRRNVRFIPTIHTPGFYVPKWKVPFLPGWNAPHSARLYHLHREFVSRAEQIDKMDLYDALGQSAALRNWRLTPERDFRWEAHADAFLAATFKEWKAVTSQAENPQKGVSAAKPQRLPKALPKGSVIIAPAWHSCGSYRVFRAQVEAHQAAGVAPYFLAIHPHLAVLGGGAGLWKNYDKNTADLGTVDRGEARLPWLNFFKPSFLSSLAAARKRTPVFTKSLSATHALLPASLAQFMASHEIVAIHCNHYFNLPAAKRVQALAPRAKIILETHDIQSFHVRQERPVNPLTLRREPFARYFEDEVAISQAADDLIHLNHEEFEAFSAALPGKSHHLIYPSLGRPAASTAPPPVRDIDFLVLGAANRGNFHSLKWFLSEVWDERLAAAANLAIVGGVADLFKVFNPSLYRKYSASFKGSVADVGAWYGRAKTVLLPISEGHGIAIKTLEAFAHAKPVIYTAQALRGFDREPVVKNLPGFAATADEFKARLQAAICSPPAALSEGAAAAAGIYEALFSPETYHAKLAAVLLGGQA